MDHPEMRPDDERRVDAKPHGAEERTADAARRKPSAVLFVDPYDMRAEPQLEEPGYGHGV